MQAKVRG